MTLHHGHTSGGSLDIGNDAVIEVRNTRFHGRSRRRRRLQRGVYHITHLQTLLYKVLKPKGTWHGMFSHLMAWRKQGWHVEAIEGSGKLLFQGGLHGHRPPFTFLLEENELIGQFMSVRWF